MWSQHHNLNQYKGEREQEFWCDQIATMSFKNSQAKLGKLFAWIKGVFLCFKNGSFKNWHLGPANWDEDQQNYFAVDGNTPQKQIQTH